MKSFRFNVLQIEDGEDRKHIFELLHYNNEFKIF
jgi:hypothetical protein